MAGPAAAMPPSNSRACCRHDAQDYAATVDGARPFAIGLALLVVALVPSAHRSTRPAGQVARPCAVACFVGLGDRGRPGVHRRCTATATCSTVRSPTSPPRSLAAAARADSADARRLDRVADASAQTLKPAHDRSRQAPCGDRRRNGRCPFRSRSAALPIGAAPRWSADSRSPKPYFAVTVRIGRLASRGRRGDQVPLRCVARPTSSATLSGVAPCSELPKSSKPCDKFRRG